jgi:protein-S-isoprenylcysteine O-methyltransferase Ste14
MLVKEHLEESGQFLFRWRGYLPLVFLALVFASLYYDYGSLSSGGVADEAWTFCCFFVGLFGILIRVLTVSFVPYNTSGRKTDQPYAGRLNKTGMYSLSRNPVYLGNFFTFLAPILFARNWWLTALYLPVFLLYHERIISAEEKFLLGKFGEEYREWVNNTPVFFPDFSLWKKNDRPFCWKTAYRRESISLFTLVATIWSLELFRDYLTHRWLMVDYVWLALFIASAAFFIGNCLLVRYTDILNV